MDGKRLASPYLTGGRGHDFEHRVQAYFLLLMLAGGRDPVMNRPVSKLKFQDRHHGFHVDDLVCCTDDDRKLLAQVKHSVSAVKSNHDFKETVQAAWRDFNSEHFDISRDRIALVTADISPKHRNALSDLNAQAWASSDASDFTDARIYQPRFMSDSTREVFETIKAIISDLNHGEAPELNTLWMFFKAFSLLTFDLEYKDSINRSLITAILDKTVEGDPLSAWNGLCCYAAECNHFAAIVTNETVPEEIKNLFKPEETEIQVIFDQPNEFWAALSLVGAWSESNEHDVALVERVSGCAYPDIRLNLLYALNRSESWMSFANGVWKMRNQNSMINMCAGYFTDRIIIAAFEAEKEFLTQRSSWILENGECSFCMPIGGEFSNSTAIRRGLTRGLCMICNNKGRLPACSDNVVVSNCISFIRELFNDCDTLRLLSLHELLNPIAEMDPGTYLAELEKLIVRSPEVISALFRRSQRNRAYIPEFDFGLVNSLQLLAWSEKHLPQSLCCLGMVADCTESAEAREFVVDKMSMILLPWHVQTLASADVQISAVKSLGRTSPEILWPLLKQLVPGGKQFTGVGRKPMYIAGIMPDDIKTSMAVYSKLSQEYISMMFNEAGKDPTKLAEMSDCLNHFNRDDRLRYLGIVQAEALELRDEEKYEIWNELSDIKCRSVLVSIENDEALDEPAMAALQAAIDASEPVDIRIKHKRLYLAYLDEYFVDRSEDYFTNAKRKEADKAEAVLEIYENYGINSVVDFGRSVDSSSDVGYKLGQKLEPDALDGLIRGAALGDITTEFLAFILSGFICTNGAEAVLNTELINSEDSFAAEVLSKTRMTAEDLPIVSRLLKTSEYLYWMKVSENNLVLLDEKDVLYAIDHLRKVQRSATALNLCEIYIYQNMGIPSELLLSLLEEAAKQTDINDISERSVRLIIRRLESRKGEDIGDRLAAIEFSLLPLLGLYLDYHPDALFAAIGCSAELFCKFINLAYKKRHQNESDVIELSQALRQRLGILSVGFRAVPGTDWAGNFDAAAFVEWLTEVKTWAKENDRYDIAMQFVGRGISYAPKRDRVLIYEPMIAALNDADAEEMRKGYILGVMNQRGAHFIDTTGGDERALAEKYRKASEEALAMGYSRYSQALNSIAEYYTEEARQNVKEEEEERKRQEEGE